MSWRSRWVIASVVTWLAVGACGSVRAQATVVVPAAYDQVEATGTAFWAFSPFRARRQLLIDAQHLGPVVGRTLLSLSVRRNTGSNDSLDSGALDLQIHLSHSPANADAPSHVFANNRGPDHRLVFSGRVDLATAPPSPASPAPWSAPYIVEVPFTVPFPYSGGTLCIETVTDLSAGSAVPWWTIDAAVTRVSGQSLVYGRTCEDGFRVGAETASLALGSSPVLYLTGEKRRGNAICLIGLSDQSFAGLPLPIDLSLIGATGCDLNTSIEASLSTVIRQVDNREWGHATVTLRLPRQPSLVGQSFFAQWGVADDDNALGVVFTEGIKATVGPPAAPQGVGWVESVDLASPSGRSLPGRVPVLRLHH